MAIIKFYDEEGTSKGSIRITFKEILAGFLGFGAAMFAVKGIEKGLVRGIEDQALREELRGNYDKADSLKGWSKDLKKKWHL
jgi:hypothetical protein